MDNNPFWQYSLTVYRRPAVAELCLQLQDDYGVDINMLLCAAWLASIGQPLTASLLQTLQTESEQWQQQCVQPLREARRFLKHNSSADIYQQAKALELQAEAVQQQRLYLHVRQLPLAAAQQDLLPANVAAYLSGCVADKTVLDQIVQQFTGLLSQHEVTAVNTAANQRV
ncbi:TIGR02444 family protein [Dasania sp. GY-MA-18]|uniref:TIGR02444 family protein n=1 Tax=Dasania phycosphaerae TaxID=2950436 RepID=A0A9J6RKC6_9GAMM|nr:MULTISPECIES: TIGR02444 family protein [Dasania]MCR8922219.1 TIGR02444 family protein [Dasania sp. GY-MA-18]MCZ0864647.1 TIGR02444 family protein [Dasania phycosphaerae]MCZ0868375.1 TIGR02444 family protein [Dasania phycosphaerae]